MNGDQRVQEIAYYIWLREGQPEGQAERHWRIATSLVEEGDAERKEFEGEPPGEAGIEDPAPSVKLAENHIPRQH
ncbi:MAG: DUF2934 domain-containing protein [Bradyrhizobium sp.]|nr:MAG: DUF2934 domain-containing protein [Bradyrhizobium sp.]